MNPSGKTVDTFVADCTLTPTYVNFNKGDGATSYSNASYTRDIWLSKFKGGPDFDARFREYEEGVYMATVGTRPPQIWTTSLLIICLTV